jgi:hypothetical protein
MQVVGFLKEREETEVMAALNLLDVAKLNEVLAIFRRFVKSADGNSVSYFHIFPMSQKLMANLGSLRASKHAETLMKAVSEHFSRTSDLNIKFTCFLVVPVGKKYDAGIARPGAFGVSMEAMCNREVATLATVFSYDITQMTSLFQEAIVELFCESSRTFIHSQITIATIEPRSRASPGAPSVFSLLPRIPSRPPRQVPTAKTSQLQATFAGREATSMRPVDSGSGAGPSAG